VKTLNEVERSFKYPVERDPNEPKPAKVIEEKEKAEEETPVSEVNQS